MWTFLRSLLAREAGTAALEFAFALPVVVVLVAGTIEFAIMSFSISLLEGGLREAARFGITGFDPADGTREEEIVARVNEHAAGLFTISADDIETRVYEDFSDIGEAEPYTDTDGNGEYDEGEPYTDVNCNDQWDEDMAAAGAGGGNDVVVYTITHEYDTITGLLDPIIAPGGTISMEASVAVRNEPFPGGSTVCSAS